MTRLCCSGGSFARRGNIFSCHACGKMLTEAAWVSMGCWRARLTNEDSSNLSKSLLALLLPYKKFCSKMCYLLFKNGELAHLSDDRVKIRKKLMEVMRSASAAEYHVADAYPSLAETIRRFRKDVESEFWSIVTNG